MSRFTSYAALTAAALIIGLPQTAWTEDTPPEEPAAAVEQAPATQGSAAPGPYPPATPGGYAQAWQQPPQWRMPQPGYGYFQPRYPQAGQYPAYPAAPATAAASPLSAELKQAQEELSAKSGELDAARGQLDQVQGKLQDCLAADARLTNELDYSTREQQALRVRVTELLSTVNTARATLEQQHQLISDHQAQHHELTLETERLHGELAGRDEQLAALQSELETTTQALAESQARTGSAIEALTFARQQIEAHRNALAELEAELERQVQRLQDEP